MPFLIKRRVALAFKVYTLNLKKFLHKHFQLQFAKILASSSYKLHVVSEIFNKLRQSQTISDVCVSFYLGR